MVFGAFISKSNWFWEYKILDFVEIIVLFKSKIQNPKFYIPIFSGKPDFVWVYDKISGGEYA